jgi:diguanylate cyclase (GGDEF)-like protein
MNSIDPRTAIVLVSTMSGLMALVLYALKRSYPPSIQGLDQWSRAMLIVVVGGAFAASRGKLPELFTTAVPNFLLCWGVYGLYAGSQRFFGGHPRPLPWLAFISGVILATMWFTWGSPNYAVRLRMITVVFGLLFGLHAWLIYRQGALTFARTLAIGVLTFITLIQVARLITTFVFPMGNDILDPTPQHVIFIASFSFSILLLSISAVLMAGDSLRTELEHLATRDSLTNALTRRYMDEACAHELARSRRNDKPLALLMMDLDHFKRVNDTHGHQAGDTVLVDFAKTVRTLLRSKDFLGRFGGEEFVVLLPETPSSEALVVAERIRAACANPPDATQIACTVSIGITTNTDNSDTLDTLMARADAALYRAKAEGRNRVVVG